MSPLKYEKSESFEIFLPILHEYTQWFHNLLAQLFYSDECISKEALCDPTGFSSWVEAAGSNEKVNAEILLHLNTLHSDLLKKASGLYGERVIKVSYKQFRELVALYEEFVFNLHRLEKEILAEENGFDSFTGLRSKNALISDVSCEMERFSRQGRRFCLALARIDHFDEIVEVSGKDKSDSYVKIMSGLIKSSIRSFDDAYYMDDGLFVLCLKQADITGGFSALERLRWELKQKEIFVYLKSEQEKSLSLSCCIAEPVVGDKVEDLLQNLKDDLEETDMENADTVLKYRELSSLERYAQSVKES